MKVLLFLGAVLLLSAIKAGAAPYDEEVPPPPPTVGTEPCESDTPEPDQVHYRKETSDTVSRTSSEDTSKTKTKSNEKVKVKHMKNGMIKTTIVDTSKTKTKHTSVKDEYNQTNHTLTENGMEDDCSLTQDHKHVSKETDTIKKKDKKVIITDREGHVVSDTETETKKEKVKKREKDKQTSKMVHTGKHVEPPPEICDDVPAPPAPAPDC